MKKAFLVKLTLILTTFPFFFQGCEQKEIKIDQCAADKLVYGHIIGYDQCLKGKGFVIATSMPIDTMVTYNLPDTLYTSYPDISSPIYRVDFLFPMQYWDKYPVHFGFDVTPKEQKQYTICPADINIAHFYTAVKDKQITITCTKKK